MIFRPAGHGADRVRDGGRIVVGQRAAVGGDDLAQGPTCATHGRRSARQRFQGREPGRLVRAGRQRDVGRRDHPGNGVPVVDEAGEVDWQPGGLTLEPGAQRALTHDDEPGVDAGVVERAERIDAAVDALLTDSRPQWTSSSWVGAAHRRRTR